MLTRKTVDDDNFNPDALYPYNLREIDFKSAMQDVYDFFYDVNTHLMDKDLPRLDNMLRPSICSGLISDMLTESLAKHSRSLVVNAYHNGHPDLILKDSHPDNAVSSATEGVEIKTTKKAGGAVDTHGGRAQWMCAFVYRVDQETKPVKNRAPIEFTEVYLSHVIPEDFRRNERSSDIGTRTSTLDKDGLKKLRAGWIYRNEKYAVKMS